MPILKYVVKMYEPHMRLIRWVVMIISGFDKDVIPRILAWLAAMASARVNKAMMSLSVRRNEDEVVCVLAGQLP
nr:hypothetical protein [Tanacetum cinerariifolium]